MPRVHDAQPPAGPRTRTRSRPADGLETSCDLLLTLCTRDPVGELVGRFGVSAGQLLAARRDLESVLGPESADWRLRLEARGGGSSDLEQLLAICRSAECHAYQLLEQVGLQCAALRREIIILLRQADRPLAPPRGHEAAARPSGVRMARERRPAAVHTRARPRRAVNEPIVDRPGNTRRAPASPPTPQNSVRTAPTRTRASRQPGDDQPAIIRAGRARGPARAVEPEPRAPAPPQEAPVEVRTPLEACRVDPSTLPPLEGRTQELAQLCDALGRHSVRVPLLVGAPGSGRTLLALHSSAHFDVPVYRLVATAYDTEDALAQDLAAVQEVGGIVLFDDLDRVPSEVAPPFLNALSHAWTQGTPRVLTVVSPEGHGRLAAWLPGALATADAITMGPLRGAPLSAAVKGGSRKVLEGHGIPLGPDLRLAELTRWAERYLTGLAMPARALDLLDLACARAKRSPGKTVRRDHVLQIVSERSGLATSRIEARGDHDVLDLEQRLAETVVGHEHATATLAQLIRRNRAGFGGQRPVLSTLLLGPSGVGKTELAKALAVALFDDADALFRLDMSEYSESHAVARVVGAPPGYVGHEHGGALTDPLLQRPHCVVLLDEIEKAHRDVHQLLLQVFDEGRLTDGRGRTVDFRHAVLVMTSNLGAHFVQAGPDGPQMDEPAALGAAREAFPVELWNRIEAPLVMHPLGAPELGKICRRLARASSDRLFKERGIRFTLDDDAVCALVELAGRDPLLGARPLRHLLVREVESVLADAVLRGRLRAGTETTVIRERGRFSLR
ncbi:MAG: AAA family ATPase [Myxococcota bacterium]